MTEFFAVRNLDEKTRAYIAEYAHERNLNMAQALREIVCLVQEHLRERQKPRKRYRSFFEVLPQIAFESSDPNLSKNIDKILYGKR